jgi:hypothetical protein
MPRTADLEKFRTQLISAFPPQQFYGPIARCECEECSALRRELPGKRWDQIPAEFVDLNSGALCLLEPGALAAFLAAWLWRSMETLDDKSVLAEFTVYSLCPGSDDEGGWNETRIAEMVRLFDRAQRSAVGLFLRSTLYLPQLSSAHAEFGLKWWCA